MAVILTTYKDGMILLEQAAESASLHTNIDTRAKVQRLTPTMACIGRHNTTPSNFQDAHSSLCCLNTNPSSSFIRTRRPALVPPNCTLSLAEAEMVYTRTQQPLFPPPDPQLSQDFRSGDSEKPYSFDPEESEGNMNHEPVVAPCWEHDPVVTPTTSYNTSLAASVARNPRRRSAKARAQYARDRSLRSATPDKRDVETSTADLPAAEIVRLAGVGTKRKLPAFVQEEEFKFQLEDRASTLHPSELSPGEEMVVAPLGVEDLAIGGKVAALSEAQ
ncbi:hypothetical protein BDV96DRAFT_307878 [Lophiotrema nucula]|uniref:Uncharacterized protein n=1 Tax=Lophiotrema nucula TaxID=690887 RepID=A0A6A5YJE1_9PLEO|nr:hypothetical protein BDV96DRAFT_307878 [Lophiotrema nucula]